MVQKKNLFLCLASIAVLATAILGTCFVVMGVKAAPSPLTDEQKIYNFLIQEYEGVTNAERLGITDLTDKFTWTGFTFNAGGRLTSISVQSKNVYGSLGVSDCSLLSSITITKSKLVGLDVSGCTALTKLNCEINQLTVLDVSKNTKLTSLSCSNNQLIKLDVSDSIELNVLNCLSNQLTELDISKNIKLTDLNCGNNQLTEIDVSNNAALKYLNCWSNQLTELNLSNNTALTYLSCFDNQLIQLDVSKNTELTELNCYNNQLTELNVSGCPKISSLYWKLGTSLNLMAVANPLKEGGYLANPSISSFMLFPYVDDLDGETYARALVEVNGTKYELNIKFDVPFTVPDYIYASIAISESTGKIDFNTYVQTSYPFYGCTSDGTITGISHQSGGGWEKFTGTFNNNSMNVTLHYNPLGAGEHGITYYNDKGQTHANPTTYTEGQTITLEPLTETDRYIFDGWFDAPEGGEKITVIPETANEDIVLWARWTAKIFNIVYSSDIPLGDIPTPETYTCEDGTIYLVNLDDTEEYKFEGWFDASEGGNRIESFESDEIGGKEFYARWSEITGTTDPGTDPTDPGGNGGGTKPGKPNIYLWGGIGLLILAILLVLIIYFGVKRYGKKKELK